MMSTATQSQTALLSVSGLSMHFPVHAGLFRRQVGAVQAVDDVSFEVMRGETLGLVGESGCGKSTVGRSILRLYNPTSGKIVFDGQDITHLRGEALRRIRPRIQMIFQDPQASLNPRMTVGAIIAEPLMEHMNLTRGERESKVRELMDAVGLSDTFYNRYAHEFSGGQRQRIGIARALSLKPDLIVCDEPIAALDVSIQAQVMNLLADLQQSFGLTYLFISHDLSMVRHFADRVSVMYLGKIVEVADVQTLFNDPQHPYTKALLSAIPVPDPEIEASRTHTILKGDVPSPLNPPPGCRFSTRCEEAIETCFSEEPDSLSTSNRQIACHLYGQSQRA